MATHSAGDDRAKPRFWRFMRPAMSAPAVLLVIAVLFFGYAAWDEASDDALRAAPVAAVAQVLELERVGPATSKGRPSFRVALQVPGEGGGFRHDLPIPENVWYRLRGAQTAEIWQQADNPHNLRLALAFSLDPPVIHGYQPAAWMFALLGLGLLGWEIGRRLPAWRALSVGERATIIVERHETRAFRDPNRPGRGKSAVGRRKPADKLYMRATWTGRDGRLQATPWHYADSKSLPPEGSQIEVAIDPKTGREFCLSELEPKAGRGAGGAQPA